MSYTYDTKPTGSYTNDTKPTLATGTDEYLLQENGDYLLQESGDKIITVDGSGSTYTYDTKPSI